MLFPKRIVSLGVLGAMHAVQLASAQGITVKEVTHKGNGVAYENLGPTFDLRNPLEITVSGPDLPLHQSITSELKDLVDIANEADKGLVDVAAWARGERSDQVNANLAGGHTVKIMSIIGEKYPGLREEIANQFNAQFVPNEAVRTTYARFFDIARVAARAVADKIKTDLGSDEYHVQLTVTQYRQNRQGRTYPATLADLFNPSDADIALANQLAALNLPNRIKQIGDEFVQNLKSDVTNRLQPPVDQLKSDFGTANGEVNQIVADLESIKTSSLADPKAFYNMAVDAISNMKSIAATISGGTAQADVNALITAAKTILTTDLPTRFNELLHALSSATEIAQIAQQVKDLVLHREETNKLTIGTSSSAPKADFLLDLQNGDKVRIEAKGRQEGQPENENQVLLDQSSYSFKFGDNWLRTVTYDGIPKIGSDRFATAPAFNYMYKRLSRGSVQRNTTYSMGFGIAAFPVGLDQNDSGTQQVAGGVVLSLLDDWLTIGYARNFTLNHDFPFIGIQLPFRL